MKKVLLMIFLSLFAIILSLSVFADSEVQYDEAELKATLRGAMELYNEFFEDCTDLLEGEEVYFYPDPYPELGRPYSYAIRTDKYRMWTDFIAALDTYYSDSAKELFLRKVESTEKDGYTYTCLVLTQSQGPDYVLDSEFDNISLDDNFKVVSVSDKKITASFNLVDGIALFDPPVITRTIEFSFENGTWVVSGGVIVDEFIASRRDSPFTAAPPTGDGTFALLALAVVSASVAFVCRRRMKRVS